MNPFRWIGNRVIRFVEEAGRIIILFLQTLGWIFRPPLEGREILKQMQEVGVRSFPVVVITAGFTGMVLALQSFTGFKRFGAETMVGTVVALSMTRELGPVLTGLMVSGRVGSAMAAELGTMRVTEQIDALYTLATNPIKYLIVPRFLAAMIMLPILVVFADVIGILGGYLVGVQILGTNPTLYFRRRGWKTVSFFKGLFYYKSDGEGGDLRVFYLPFHLRWSHQRSGNLKFNGKGFADGRQEDRDIGNRLVSSREGSYQL